MTEGRKTGGRHRGKSNSVITGGALIPIVRNPASQRSYTTLSGKPVTVTVGDQLQSYLDCVAAAREYSLDSTKLLIKMAKESTDERLVFMCCKEIYDRAWGPPDKRTTPDPDSRAEDEQGRMIVDALRELGRRLREVGEPSNNDDEVIEAQANDEEEAE
jgi:hypothetical protein